MKKKLVILLAVFGIYCFTGCEDNTIDLPPMNNTLSSDLKSAPVNSHYFNWWEVNEYNNIGMPWLNGYSTFLPEYMRHDHYPEEGWELLFQNLDVNSSNSLYNKLLVLYNKYSGLLRIFYNNLSYTSSSQAQKFSIAIGLSNSSSMLNIERINSIPTFDDNNILTKYSTNSVFKTQSMTLNNISASQGFTSNSWYSAEFELLYEEVQDQTNLNLIICPYISEISNVDLSSITQGTISGDIEGTISSIPSSGSNSLIGSIPIKGLIVNNNINQETTKQQENLKEASEKKPKFFNKLWSKITSSTGNATIDGLSNLTSNIIKEGINWLSNPLTAFANKLFGSDSDTSSPSKIDLNVNLTTQSTTTTTGTISNSSPLCNIPISLPTTSSTTGGLMVTKEMEDYPLGVFTFNTAPVINITQTEIKYKSKTPSYTNSYRFTNNLETLKIVFNPKVLEECDVLDEKLTFILPLTKEPENYDYIINSNEPIKYESGWCYFNINNPTSLFYRDSQIPEAKRYLADIQVSYSLQHKTSGKIFTYTRSLAIKNFNITKTTKIIYGNPPEL